MVNYGGASKKPITIPTSSFIFNNVTLKGFWLHKWYNKLSTEQKQENFQTLAKLVETKKLRLWTERHSFERGFSAAVDRAENSLVRDRKVLLKFE